MARLRRTYASPASSGSLFGGCVSSFFGGPLPTDGRRSLPTPDSRSAKARPHPYPASTPAALRRPGDGDRAE